jgi:CheY-like chemotaxis protein
VLVIEDEEGVRTMLGAAFTHYGMPTWLAEGGREALNLYEQHRRAIGVVLLDVQMPGMDGPQTLTALRKVDPTIPVVFMSGNCGLYSIEDLLDLGAAGVLAKPFSSLAELVRVLRQAAEGRYR